MPLHPEAGTTRIVAKVGGLVDSACNALQGAPRRRFPELTQVYLARAPSSRAGCLFGHAMEAKAGNLEVRPETKHKRCSGIALTSSR